MAKKLVESGRKLILEYDVRTKAVPGKKEKVSVPVILDQKTISMRQLLKEGAMGGYFMGRENIFQTQFDCMMELVKLHLEQGDAVNLGGYFRIQPVLNGTIGSSGLLTRENSLAIRITALRKLKMRLIDFAWRRRGDRVKKI